MKKTSDELTFEDISKKYEAINKLEPNNRIKALKSLGFAVIQGYKKEDISVRSYELYSKLMRDIIKIHSFPHRYTKFLTMKLIPDWLELTGNEKVTIIKKISDKVAVDSGSMAIADAEENFNPNPATKKDYLELMKLHKWFVFSTGGDGLFNVQIRVLEASEPVLTPKEYKRVLDSSEISTIHVKSGSLVIADPYSLDNVKNRLQINVEPAYYNIAAFHFAIPNKSESFYIVLCKVKDGALKTVDRVHEFYFN